MLLHTTFMHNSWNWLEIDENLVKYTLNHEILVVEMGFIDRQHQPMGQAARPAFVSKRHLFDLHAT